MAYIGRTPSLGEVIVLKNIESSFNGTLTGFDLHRVVNGVDQDFYAISSEHLLVSLGGIIQEPDRSGNVGYTINGNQIEFAVAPAAGISCFIISYGHILAIGTVPDGYVTSAKIADGAIVNADVNASAAIADTKLSTISTAGKVSNSATTATAINTGSAIVSRDGSGNFSAGTVTAALTGNASTATALETARNIGGVSFDGTAAINLPGVNAAGNQDTSGNAATATALETARNIGGVSFDGTAAINLPGVNAAGNQDTTGNAATSAALSSARNFAVTGDVTGTVSSDLTSGASIATSIAAGVIVNADVNASAAIAGTKISPDFGSQDVTTTGLISATTKSFIIDHPTKENYKLRYACLEGPENSVYIRGRTTDNVIELPDYWTGLVDEDSITVNLTPIGNHSVWIEEINNNKVYINSESKINCFYTVFAERKDVEKLIVEIQEN